jgi:casein kinase II subunit beta
LFIQAFPDSVKYVEPNIYVARLFGFRVSELSVAGPRMQWLRMVKQEVKGQDGKETEDMILQ